MDSIEQLRVRINCLMICQKVEMTFRALDSTYQIPKQMDLMTKATPTLNCVRDQPVAGIWDARRHFFINKHS